MKSLQNIFKDKLYIFIKINIFSLMNEPLPDVSHKSRSRKKGNTTALRVQPVLQQTIDDSPASESSEEETFQEDQPPQQIAVSTKVARKRQGNTPQRMNPVTPRDFIPQQTHLQLPPDQSLFSPHLYLSDQNKPIAFPQNRVIPQPKQSETGSSIQKKFSINLEEMGSSRESLSNNTQVQELIKLLQAQGVVNTSPNHSGSNVMKSAHEAIKKQRSIVQAWETPCLDYYCEQLCWLTQFAFTIATIVLLGFYASFDYPAPFVNTFFVQAIASIAYFVKASHAGDLMIADTHIPFVRYVDWITTTPLMLYELCHIAHAESHTIVMVIGCDLITLFLGISSAVMDQEKHFGVKYTLFLIAGGFYILMVCTLMMDVAEPLYAAADEAQHHDDHYTYSDDHTDSNIKYTVELFDNLEVLTVVSWSFYPVAVLLGRAHFGIITQSVEDGFICILDIISKIGMEGMIIAYAVKHYNPSDDDGH
jgi:bacteriorhodopsin